VNGFDLAAIILFLGGAILGYLRGFVGQLWSVAGFAAAMAAAFWLYDDLAPWIGLLLPFPATAGQDHGPAFGLLSGLPLGQYISSAIAFVALFFLVRLAFSLAGKLLNLALRLPGLAQANQWSGALLGLVEAALLFAIAVNLLHLSPSSRIQEELNHSHIAKHVLEHSPKLIDKLRLWRSGQDVQDGPIL
jgi:uncharacterized membrane protein required for colicin V production